MHRRWVKPIVFVAILAAAAGLGRIPSASAQNSIQQATQVPTLMATVTGTPTGPLATVLEEQDQVNVRSGPGQLYPKVGVLLPGQTVVAKGRSAGGDWILIDYPGVQGGTGWVYTYLVKLTPGNLPIVEPPPTPTPLYTATIDPTLAAQFIVTAVPTRLPTFTPPSPLVIPTLADSSASPNTRGIPMALVIIGLGSLGIFLGLISLIRGR